MAKELFVDNVVSVWTYFQFHTKLSNEPVRPQLPPLEYFDRINTMKEHIPAFMRAVPTI